MTSLGKKRSKLGEWLDARGITQEWLAKKAGLSRNTVSALASGDSNQLPTARTMTKILNALREIDPNIKVEDIWEI